MNNFCLPSVRNLAVAGAMLGAAAALAAIGCPRARQAGEDGRQTQDGAARTNAAQANVKSTAETVPDRVGGQDADGSIHDPSGGGGDSHQEAGYGGPYTEQKYPPYFADWPQPTLTLFFTGRQHGYIEPCGCTGLANQKGGLSRRHVLFTRLKEKGFNPVAIDVGNQVRRFGRQPEIKFQTTISGLKKIGYGAIALGPDDVRLSAGELLSAAIGSDGAPAPFVCANVSVLGQTPPLRILQAAGKKIGVTAILGKAEQRGVTSDEIELSDPDAALEKIVPKLKEAKCDLYVLLSHTSIDESKRLGGKFPLFDLVVTAGSAGEPAHRLEPIEGTRGWLVQIGTKGMYVSAVGVFDGREPRFRLQRAALDGRFADSRDMLDLLKSYQQELEAVGLEGLGVKPLPHPSGRTFVGSAACADCHADEYAIWEKTPHAHATDVLVKPAERSEIPRHHDPECLSCHVTGWNPQEHYPYKSGYLSLEKTKHLMQMGCENCHGPGSDHVAAENGELDEPDKHREEMVLSLQHARDRCMQCHDLDNSPDFHAEGAFEKYWERVKH